MRGQSFSRVRLSSIKLMGIKKLLDKYLDLFTNLARNIRCPMCSRFVKPPFYNLGVKYNSFEGCKDCYERLVDDNVIR